MKILDTRVIFLPSEADDTFAQICRLFRLTRYHLERLAYF